MPQIKNVIREMLMSAAASLDTVPADEQIVFFVFLSRYPWEDTSGMPAQMQFLGHKKTLLEVQRNSGQGLENVVRVIEY
jgi:hypothetical protein